MVNQLDDNLIPGQTYTFTFQQNNYFLPASQSGIMGDLDAQAPDFVTNYIVGFAPQIGHDELVVITFTYGGDGSDVVNDVAQALIAAALAGSSDKLSFVQAEPGGTSSVGRTGAPTPGSPGGTTPTAPNATCSIDNLSACVPSSSALWAVAVIAVLFVFVISGGPGISRSLTAQ